MKHRKLENLILAEKTEFDSNPRTGHVHGNTRQKSISQSFYTFFLYENYNFASASIFLTFPEIEPEIFLNFS